MKSTISYLVLLMTLSANAAENEGVESVNRPNVLFCIADDAGHMGAYGFRWVKTPHFDRVAKEGLLFANMYTCNAKSAPSRATMITGRNSWQLEEACNHWANFPAKFKSFPEVLSENGYEVGYTGKGWAPGVAKDKYGKPRFLTGKPWNRERETPPTAGISTIAYSANFKDFMRERDKDKPFFFWYGAMEPHRKYEFNSSARYGKILSDIDKVPSYWPDNDVVRRDMLDYSVEIEHFDNHLGQILETLEKSGELENTIVIVTSDHNMPFPRCKGQDYYHSNHIPMAIMWGKKIQSPGRRIEEYISSIDLAPTILEVAGIQNEKSGMQPITGRSFVDILTSNEFVVDRGYVMMGKERHDVGRPYDKGYPIRSILRGDFLYIVNFKVNRWPAGNPETGYMNVDGSPTKTEILKCRRIPDKYHYWELSFGKRSSEEMYNIRKDPDCMDNLVKDSRYEQVREQLRKEMFLRLVEQEDPRVFGQGDIFDRYSDMSGAHNYWERTRKGEQVQAGWILPTDFDNE